MKYNYGCYNVLKDIDNMKANTSISSEATTGGQKNKIIIEYKLISQRNLHQKSKSIILNSRR